MKRFAYLFLIGMFVTSLAYASGTGEGAQKKPSIAPEGIGVDYVPNTIPEQSAQRDRDGNVAVSWKSLSLTEQEKAIIRKGNYTAALAFHTTQASAWYNLHLKAIKDVFDDLNIKILTVTDAQFKPELQADQLDSLIAMNPNIIIGIPVDEVTLAAAFKKVSKAGIHLTLIDNIPVGMSTKTGDYDTCVMIDGKLEGMYSGDMLARAIGGKGKIGMMWWARPSYSNLQRKEGALEIWKTKYPGIQVVNMQGITNAEDTYATVQSMMAANPEIQGIWACWTVPAMQTLGALRDMNRSEVPVATMDIDNDVAVALAKNTQLKGLASMAYYEKGRATAIASVYPLIPGKAVPPFVATPEVYVVRQNLLAAWEQIMKQKPPQELLDAMNSSK
jgi:ribose transport system substrate-binding protein